MQKYIMQFIIQAMAMTSAADWQWVRASAKKLGSLKLTRSNFLSVSLEYNQCFSRMQNWSRVSTKLSSLKSLI